MHNTPPSQRGFCGFLGIVTSSLFAVVYAHITPPQELAEFQVTVSAVQFRPQPPPQFQTIESRVSCISDLPKPEKSQQSHNTLGPSFLSSGVRSQRPFTRFSTPVFKREKSFSARSPAQHPSCLGPLELNQTPHQIPNQTPQNIRGHRPIPGFEVVFWQSLEDQDMASKSNRLHFRANGCRLPPGYAKRSQQFRH